MQDQAVGQWLEELASEASTPGGGAAAAMHASIGAALVSMVCNLTLGRPKFAVHEAMFSSVLDRADKLRVQALALAGEDADAFGAVVAAYGLPKETDDDRRVRTGFIQQALVGAAEVPLRVAALAAEVVDLCAAVLDGANPNVLSDVAVAASSAKAALEAAVVNVEVNLATLADPGRRADLAAQLAAHLVAVPRADAVVAAVRARIAR
ncbi:cyclodeaminase/cyclohydrolase family protein [Actinosynnema sp. NPDC020468]|uniref:cyclodeaminase/cyclohydrolase family protein n=1 Tax=Actinosynnema sp. NPDC020468 TaxID=3154488 RepID=UPI0033FCB8B6